jgi:hypothetical protein
MVGQSSLLEEEEIYHHSPQPQQMKQSQKINDNQRENVIWSKVVYVRSRSTTNLNLNNGFEFCWQEFIFGFVVVA